MDKWLDTQDKLLAEWHQRLIQSYTGGSDMERYMTTDCGINLVIEEEAQSEIDQKDKQIAMLKKRANELECEISTLDLIISRHDADIAELVDMLEEMLYSNSTKYRGKAEALIYKHRGK